MKNLEAMGLGGGPWDVVASRSLPGRSPLLALIVLLLGMLTRLPLAAQSPIADDLDPGTDGKVNSLAVQADGKVLVGGNFTMLGGQLRSQIGRLNPDGTLDTTFNPGASGGNGTVASLALQADGKILVGGGFDLLGGQPRNGLGRLNADGTLDTTFDPGANGLVTALSVQTDGKILVGGHFTALGGQERSRIGRLNADGTLDTDFNPGAFGLVFCLALEADGRVLVGGTFITLGGQPRSNLGRLNADGTLDAGFDPVTDRTVNSLVVQADGKILAGGEFRTLGGQPRDSVARLNADGTLDTDFNPGVSGGFIHGVVSLALQADGKILVGGEFTALGGQPRSNLGRLNPDGTLDTAFDPRVGGNALSLALQPDGKILVGGFFPVLGGQPRRSIGRLNNTEPAIQDLTRDGTTVRWRRGGTTPEVSEVVFEHTQDGLNWSRLGDGTRVVGGWELGGVPVPEGGTLRARGRVSGGQWNGSSWLAETYAGAPAWITTPRSRTNHAETTATFEALVTGVPPFRYEWRKNGVALTDGGNVAGAATATLTLGHVLKPDEGAYSVRVSNADGQVTSIEALLTVQDPVITVQPQSQNRELGESVLLSVDAMGTRPLAYQWHRDGVPLEGATDSRLTVSNLQAGDAGAYTVVVSNAHGTDGSVPAGVTVNRVTLDTAFDPLAGDGVRSVALQSDGKILVGGSFTTLGGQPRNNLGRLNADGTLDLLFNSGAGDAVLPQVNALAVQPDGRILVGGDFSTLGGQPRNYLGRLERDGTLDPHFDPGANRDVLSLAVQPDGKILVGGDLRALSDQPRNYLGRLNGDGTLDSNFDPGANDPVNALALQSDGRILVGGFFTSLGGQSRERIGRLNADGTLDAAFNPGADARVNSLVVQVDGKILVGGEFTVLGGQPRNGIGRLNADGTLDPTFNPGADRGMVNSLAVQADGKILVGGYFTALGGLARSNLGRLNADGTPDMTFNPGAGSDLVSSLAVQADGRILVGGFFSMLGGQPRNGLGRLNNADPPIESLTHDGTTVTWLRDGAAPEVSDVVFEHTHDGVNWSRLGEGARIAGGWKVTGVAVPETGTLRGRGRVSGGNGSSWLTEAYAGVPVWIVAPAGQTHDAETTATLDVRVGGSPPLRYEWRRNGVALTDGGNVSGSATATLILTHVLKPDEGAYSVRVSNAEGQVTSIEAVLTVRDPVITAQPQRQDRNVGQDITLNVNAAGTRPLAYQWHRDGVAVEGATESELTLNNLQFGDAGAYTVVVRNAHGEEGSVPAQVTVNGVTLDLAFNPGPSGSMFPYSPEVYSLAVQADGKVLVGGRFTRLSGQARSNLGRLNADGTLDTTFNAGAEGVLFFASPAVYSLAIQADGKILVGGRFTMLGGQPRSNLGRLNADGTLDADFDPGAGDALSWVSALGVQPDGKILVGGTFTTLGGHERNSLGRLNADGTLDSAFNPGADGDVESLVPQADGKILVGGGFTTLGGLERNRIGRLNADGTPDADFNPGVGDRLSRVSAFVIQPDGKILVAGVFTTLGGQARSHLGRLNADGTLDAGFNPGADDRVASLALQSDGKIVARGDFRMLGGQPRNHLGRLNADGTLDNTFNPGMDGGGNPLAVQPDGKILVGGAFTTLGGQARENLGRFNNTGPATQRLTYEGTTVTWLRGGTSPEVWRTAFEWSRDAVAWSSLGDGRRVPGGWELDGASLPSDGTLRARGYVGNGNGSWFVEAHLTGENGDNVAPVLAAVPDRTIAEETALELTLSATDADLPAQTLTYSLVAGPDGMTVSPAGALAWTPTEAQGPSINSVTVRVSDGDLNAEQTFQVIVTEVNTAPVLVAVADQDVPAGGRLTLVLVATDADLPAQTLTFSLVTGPAGLTVSPAGPVLWIPDPGQSPSTNWVVVRVTDGIAQREGTFTVRVLAPEGGDFAISIGEFDANTGRFELRWPARPGQRFQPEFQTQLGDTVWLPAGEVITATGSVAAFLVTTDEQSARLFRVVYLP